MSAFVPRPPQLWGFLARRWLQVPDALAWQWWAALNHATWSVPRAWKDAIIAFDRQPRHVQTVEAVYGFLQVQCTAEAMLTVLENLVHEQVLTRRQSSAIEEHVFRRLDACGRWQ